MLVKNIKLGLRVKVKSNGLTALVVGTPEYYTPRSKLVRIKYENSTRYEYIINNQIDPLPNTDQYPALGGKFVKPEGHF
tara:strand:+ start:1487 stop:1723 length:237 start_codon:yes stop_codon:yes gene_type:complete